MARKTHETWQLRLLPLMMAFVVGAAVFFSAVVLWRFVAMDDQLAAPRGGIEALGALPAGLGDDAKAALALERYLIERRYDQASLIVRARLWTRFVGFITGMLLALVGATFVLGKLEEPQASQASGTAEVAGHKLGFALSSASPGIVLAMLGTVLMALTIAIPGQASTQDAAIYYHGGNPLGVVADPGLPDPSPPCPPGETDPFKCLPEQVPESQRSKS
ncbi:hypothetical protein [Caulobacter sp. UNC358MFTsu5.1]|uniref:hypothetical protein n=1 Tax=Caulobacter sp. UNC358MFTsu5.1 TaxID=1449049 RepID=UPI0012DC9D57|nr:hypothetical protein [Caulobacter sp. UNC358MFTsu5.1]